MTEYIHPVFWPRNTNKNISELVFIEDNPKKTGILDPDRLDIIIFHDLQNIQNIDTLKIFITRNIHIQPTIFNDDLVLPGFGVNEIITPVGYTFANESNGLFEPSDPTYNLNRNRDFDGKNISFFETKEDDVHISLIFSKVAENNFEAILIHEFPQIVHQPEFTSCIHERNFKLLGVERGRKLEDIKLI